MCKINRISSLHTTGRRERKTSTPDPPGTRRTPRRVKPCAGSLLSPAAWPCIAAARGGPITGCATARKMTSRDNDLSGGPRNSGHAERSSEQTLPPRTVRFVPDAHAAPWAATTTAQGQPRAHQPHQRHEEVRHSLAPGLSGFAGAVRDAHGEDSPGGGESKKCNCKKSKCLKLYCECFAGGAFCHACSCQSCQNTPHNVVGPSRCPLTCEQVLLATSPTRLVNPRFWSSMASYNVCLASTMSSTTTLCTIARHVIDTHFEPSFLELNSVL